MTESWKSIDPESLTLEWLMSQLYVIPPNRREYSCIVRDQMTRFWNDWESCALVDLVHNAHFKMGPFLGTNVVIGGRPQEIQDGGNVYDMDNIVVRTPLNHILGSSR